MNPFTRKLVKSQAEKDRLIQEAAKEWDELGEHSYLVAASEEDYLTRVADGIEVESPAFVPARELTKAERDEIDGELLFSKIYDGRTSYVASEDVPAWYRPIHEQEQRASFEKLVAPAIRERKWLEAMVNEAFEKAREQLAEANSPSI